MCEYVCFFLGGGGGGRGERLLVACFKRSLLSYFFFCVSMLSQRCRANLYANDGLLTHAGEIHRNKKYIQSLLNLLVQFSFLQNKATKRFDEKWWAFMFKEQRAS